MRLSKIKLAGFKSFVEPTTIQFPDVLTGIIGPNGCGKSNVIDAVRWVMGESSAKQLRGDSMDDVIFNGSSARPAVGRASVDLIFDNSDHQLGGQYAQYNEISVRREVTREGQSNYFLNGIKCRRRDIADIFLGTGLGPRSYAIIEQGMISRIIEAKPEDLRIYLEEAAGITKYKERRKETETRIRSTRENLERLQDVRDEIEKQITHLKRQANAAERYKQLKAEERKLKAELLALRWRVLNEKVRSNEQELQEKQTEVEAVVARQRSVELDLERKREAQTEANDEMNTVQAEFYRVGAEISRIEQTIQHNKETRQRQVEDLDKVNSSWQQLREHIEDDSAKLEDVTRTIADKEPAFAALKETQQHSSVRLAQAEQAMAEWQQAWEVFNREEAATAQSVQVEQTRQDQLQQQLERMNSRLEKLHEERENLSTAELEAQQKALVTEEARHAASMDAIQQDMLQANNNVLSARENIGRLDKQLDEVRSRIQDCRGRLASLEALQQAALGKQDKGVVQWLEKRGLHKQPRLAERMQVKDGWERAVETVLGSYLEAVCVNDVPGVENYLAELGQGSLTLLEMRAGNPEKSLQIGYLAGKVESEYELPWALQQVRIANSLQSALTMRSSLKAGESVITREGIWIGSNWLRVARSARDQGGVLEREQEIKNLKQRLELDHGQAQGFEQELGTVKQQLTAYEQRREELQTALRQANSNLSEVKGRLHAIKIQMQQVVTRRAGLSAEIAELNQQLEQDQKGLRQSQEQMKSGQIKAESNTDKREQLQARRETLAMELQQTREHAQADREALHEIALNIESMRSMKTSTDQNLGRMKQQLEHLQARRDALQSALSGDAEPIEELEAVLKQALQKRVEVDKRLGEARTQVEIVESEIRGLEQQRASLENQVQELRAGLEQVRLAAQEVRVRCQTLDEQLDESGFEKHGLLEALPQEASADAWTEEVAKIDQKIQRMGPINLAAIDEHKEQTERKEYLDAQFKDLNEALSTLESAIAKIDKETRSRFKEVFDLVNTHIREMFPRLFGGGQAYLEMTGNDLLSTGVSIMARPPGKRISNIHLLSGGEKALTAVAMVFAIFHLNPAPFCMLDEVDAPLDEANVGRFCELVREMSNRVQFIVITHNKTTMEMMNQLMGVTMREAGVSRLVAVDIDAAVKMVANA
jgi:chromosome segregation protein